MTSEKDNGPLSDTEGGEKPVREQLKKAHITSGHKASKPESAQSAASLEHDTGNGENTGSGVERGRLHKKRSHEEIEGDSQEVTSQPSKHHTRKRSRDSTAEEDEINNGQRKVSGERARNGDEAEAVEVPESNGTDKAVRASTPEGTGEKRSEEAVEAMTSPKTKRSRIHSTVAEDKELPEADKPAEAAASGEEPKISEEKQSTTKIPPTSGFANASATSPFGALAGSKSPSSDPPQTSASAFASSGFSALAGSPASGFGAIGKHSGGFGSGGSFASGAKSPLNQKENDKPSATSGSSFGGALGQKSAFSTASSGSGFGSAASGFGKLGSQTTGGFGGGLGGTGFSSLGGGGLTSFASGKTASTLGGLSKSPKPFGAPADDDEKDGEDGEGDDKAGTKSPIATEEEKQDERFYEQELETGEEDESTEFSCRAKLYNFSADSEGKKEWRERGVGVLRLNVRRRQPDEDQKPTARVLMRADGSHRVVLNTPVKKEISYGTPQGEKPSGGYFFLMGAIDGQALELLQLKMKQVNALEMYDHITKLQADM